MRTRLWYSLVTAIALVAACAEDMNDATKTDAASQGDTSAADVAVTPADARMSSDSSRDLPALLASDAPAFETDRQDLLSLPEVEDAEPSADDAGKDAGLVDLRKPPEADGDAGTPDSPLADAPADTLEPDTAPRSYVCRDDSDCCIVVDHCMARAYLYSKAPGASPPPSFSSTSDPSKCLRCISPGVQVRCAGGQCTGTSSMSNSELAKDHCGTINVDSGALDSGTSSLSDFERAYESTAPISWGC
jgi:hypothetical protein